MSTFLYRLGRGIYGKGRGHRIHSIARDRTGHGQHHGQRDSCWTLPPRDCRARQHGVHDRDGHGDASSEARWPA